MALDLATILSTLSSHRLGDANASSPDSENCDACARQLARQARRKSQGNPALPATSAKIRKILELLEAIQTRGDGEEKTIIFSQFTTMLDLLQPFLKDAGIKHVRCACLVLDFRIVVDEVIVDDGSMSKPERDVALEKIRESKNTNVILISFKAGSTGA